jgi:hypothetical protein
LKTPGGAASPCLPGCPEPTSEFGSKSAQRELLDATENPPVVEPRLSGRSITRNSAHSLAADAPKSHCGIDNQDDGQESLQLVRVTIMTAAAFFRSRQCVRRTSLFMQVASMCARHCSVRQSCKCPWLTPRTHCVGITLPTLPYRDKDSHQQPKMCLRSARSAAGGTCLLACSR